MWIATWNVSSRRVRLPQVLRYLGEVELDVLCLQETRLPDARFPFDAFEARGFHVASASAGTYAGVAVVSRHPVEVVAKGIEGAPEMVSVAGSRRLLVRTGGWLADTVYVPTRMAIGKKEFFDALHEDLERRGARGERYVLAGDLNVCWDARDYASPKMISDADVHPDRPEDLALRRLVDGMTDCVRARHEEDGLFSWFPYARWALRRNYGMRLDYVFASEPATSSLVDAWHDMAPRRWERPSDHLPVHAQFE